MYLLYQRFAIVQAFSPIIFELLHIVTYVLFGSQNAIGNKSSHSATVLKTDVVPGRLLDL